MTVKNPKKSFSGILLIVFCTLLTLQLMPEKALGFDAQSHIRPRRPRFVGPLKRNRELTSSVVIAKGKIRGPEDLAIDAAGDIYTGSWNDGKVYRIKKGTDGGESVETFAETGGGNLGLQFDKQGNLIVCNSPGGLLSIDPKGHVTVLASSVGDYKINFADDLDIGSDGKIYFSNASSKYDGHEGRPTMDFDILEGRANGALLMYDPATRETKILVKDLYFANGVILSEDESYLLVNETTFAQIRRYWLKGPKAGTLEMFMDNLVGYPDGLARDGHGGYWVAFASLRSRYTDVMHFASHVRNVASHGPVWLWMSKSKYGVIINVDDRGKIITSLQDPTHKVYNITNVVPYKDYLYLGTLDGDGIARYDIRKANALLHTPGAAGTDQ